MMIQDVIIPNARLFAVAIRLGRPPWSRIEQYGHLAQYWYARLKKGYLYEQKNDVRRSTLDVSVTTDVHESRRVGNGDEQQHGPLRESDLRLC